MLTERIQSPQGWSEAIGRLEMTSEADSVWIKLGLEREEAVWVIHTTVAQVSKPPWVSVWFTVVRQIFLFEIQSFQQECMHECERFHHADFASRLCEFARLTNKKLLKLHSKWLLCELCFAHYYTIDSRAFLPAKFH